MANNTGQFFKEAEEYVNKVCQVFITPHSDFIKVEARHKGSDGICFLKLVDATDHADFFDITALDLEHICILMARIITGEETPEKLVDYQERKEAAKLLDC